MNERGRAERFQTLLQEHQKILLKVAATYCRNREDRHDLAQEISVQLWRAFPAYDARRPFATWMYRIALNVAISSLRRSGLRERSSRPLEVSEAENIPGPASDDGDERIDALYQVIDRFGALDRALLLLYLEEHSYQEIAGILGLTESNVATKLNRLKERIRREFATA